MSCPDHTTPKTRPKVPDHLSEKSDTEEDIVQLAKDYLDAKERHSSDDDGKFAPVAPQPFGIGSKK